MFYRYTVLTYWKHRRYLKYTKHYEKRILIRLGRILFLLIVLIFGHAMAMMYLENMTLGNAMWLSLTTATTVGYGDFSASTWQGRLVTVIFLYAVAISLLAQLAGEFILVKNLQNRFSWYFISETQNGITIVIIDRHVIARRVNAAQCELLLYRRRILVSTNMGYFQLLAL